MVRVTLRRFENRSSKLTLQRRAYIKIGTPTFDTKLSNAFRFCVLSYTGIRLTYKFIRLRQAVSLRPLTADFRIQSHASQRGICDRQSDNRTGFSLRTSNFLFHYHSPVTDVKSRKFTASLNNVHKNGKCSHGTQIMRVIFVCIFKCQLNRLSIAKFIHQW